MQVCMRIQIIVGIWVLVSMMDFMPGKGEHETGIFLPLLLEKRFDVVALRTNSKWWNRDYVVDT